MKRGVLQRIEAHRLSIAGNDGILDYIVWEGYKDESQSV